MDLGLEDAEDWDNPRRTDLVRKGALRPQTFEEYCGYRETKLAYWRERYVSLLGIIEPAEPIALDPSLTSLLNGMSLGGPNNVNYAKRVISYYDNQLGRAFGSLEFIDMSLIPQSLVDSINKAKVQWDN